MHFPHSPRKIIINILEVKHELRNDRLKPSREASMKYLFSNLICGKWHSMKRVSWCLCRSSSRRVSSSTTEFTLKARNIFIVPYLIQKESEGENESYFKDTWRKIFYKLNINNIHLSVPSKQSSYFLWIKIIVKAANSNNKLQSNGMGEAGEKLHYVSYVTCRWQTGCRLDLLWHLELDQLASG